MEMTPDCRSRHRNATRLTHTSRANVPSPCWTPRHWLSPAALASSFQPVLHAVIDAKSKNGTGREMATLPRIQLSVNSDSQHGQYADPHPPDQDGPPQKVPSAPLQPHLARRQVPMQPCLSQPPRADAAPPRAPPRADTAPRCAPPRADAAPPRAPSRVERFLRASVAPDCVSVD